ncbi:MAG TPA: GerMN domain-containing protein [Candidatus Limnocylindria bacterium]|nr:GerMN domain-containing protein [Candidatus Limnocylindria bacterium]
MTPRWRVRLLAGLALAVIAAAIYFPILRRRVQRAARLQQQSEEQARRELTLTLPTNPGQPRVKTTLFWASGTEDGALVPTTVELPLSDDPVLRAKQVLNTLLAGPVDVELRTLPPDAALLEFYLLPDGTGIADFSEALATSIPSGIQSEQLALDSITRTLQADVPQVQRLKILIHGQEAETLAGHLDLTGAFVVNAKAALAPAKPAQAEAGKLTPGNAPGKLAQPEHKP